ncbi:MAG: FecR domain-containing protein, partial [Magnetospirillum sp.]|nr:FecR domain-containing protein [Magnetospirillum sp.]
MSVSATSKGLGVAGQQGDVVQPGPGASVVTLPAGSDLGGADYVRHGSDLEIILPSGQHIVIPGFFDGSGPHAVATADGQMLPADLVARLAGPLAPAQFAQADGATAGAGLVQIGVVDKYSGTVTVRHADGTTSVVKAGDAIYQGDVIETAHGGAVGIVLADRSTFALGSSGRLVMDELVYDPATKDGHANLSVLKGSFSFISGQISHAAPDAMQVRTPVMTIGVRGTTVAGQVGDNGQTSVALVGDVGGGAGQIVVRNAGGTQVLSQPNTLLTVASSFSPPPPPVFVPPNEIASAFGAAISNLPVPPANNALEWNTTPGNNQPAPVQQIQSRPEAGSSIQVDSPGGSQVVPSGQQQQKQGPAEPQQQAPQQEGSTGTGQPTSQTAAAEGGTQGEAAAGQQAAAGQDVQGQDGGKTGPTDAKTEATGAGTTPTPPTAPTDAGTTPTPPTAPTDAGTTPTPPTSPTGPLVSNPVPPSGNGGFTWYSPTPPIPGSAPKPVETISTVVQKSEASRSGVNETAASQGSGVSSSGTSSSASSSSGSSSAATAGTSVGTTGDTTTAAKTVVQETASGGIDPVAQVISGGTSSSATTGTAGVGATTGTTTGGTTTTTPTSTINTGNTPGSSSGGTSTAPTSTSGRLVDGPVSGAQVFLDVNGDGVYQSGTEPVGVTDGNGYYTISGAGNYAIIALPGGTDIVTGHTINFTMKAPPGSTVVSPLTTLVAEVGEAKVKQLLGLPASASLTTTDPTTSPVLYAAGIQVVTTINAMKNGLGLSQEQVMSALKTAMTNTSSTSGDFLTNTATLTSVVTAAGGSAPYANFLADVASAASTAQSTVLAGGSIADIVNPAPVDGVGNVNLTSATAVTANIAALKAAGVTSFTLSSGSGTLTVAQHTGVTIAYTANSTAIVTLSLNNDS